MSDVVFMVFVNCIIRRLNLETIVFFWVTNCIITFSFHDRLHLSAYGSKNYNAIFLLIKFSSYGRGVSSNHTLVVNAFSYRWKIFAVASLL